MKIGFRINGKLLESFPLLLWRHGGSFFMWLRDLDITAKTGSVTPVYQPLITVERHPGQFVFIWFQKQYGHMFIFQKKYPYIHYEKFISEIEEPEDEDQV